MFKNLRILVCLVGLAGCWYSDSGAVLARWNMLKHLKAGDTLPVDTLAYNADLKMEHEGKVTVDIDYSTVDYTVYAVYVYCYSLPERRHQMYYMVDNSTNKIISIRNIIY